MKHPVKIKGYKGDIEKLAIDVANLRYDFLYKFLSCLSLKLRSDAQLDRERKRVKLAMLLHGCASHISTATSIMLKAWRLCDKNMKEKKHEK